MLVPTLGGAGFRLILPKAYRNEKLVIVDDEPNIGPSLKLILEREGYTVAVCRSGEEFRGNSAHRRADAYLLDVKLPDGNGIDLLRFLRQNGSDSPVIMISGHGSIADAVEATRSGAFDFLEKPLARDRVLLVLKNAIEQATLRRENQQFREIVGDAPRMIGSSPSFVDAVEQASRVARSDARVLLLGESGTGKELLAAHIHSESPFAAVLYQRIAYIPTELESEPRSREPREPRP
jgi:two-component system nitrogen regulation response regulator NtrX